MPNALLIYPEQPPTFWGVDFALDIFGFKAMHLPLGLITIASMFPPGFDVRLVDMNVSTLEDADLEWADMAFTSAMITQRFSLQSVIERCGRAGVPVVAGGPYPTTFHAEIEGVDHFVLDEAEEIFPEFLRDLENGTARAVYREPRKPDVTRTPVPRFDLVDMKSYSSMSVQFSRGCPFDCEFCDIIKLFGQVTRTKSPDQILEEFDTLYRLGWRGPVFLVDDNFIGNAREALKLLPAVVEWQKSRGYPFALFTEASVNLARMDKLMDTMIEAGFNTVFLGLETPNPEALLKTKKRQNTDKRNENYLFDAVRKIQRKGMQVLGGFIVGLDSDGEGVFDAQIEFVQEAGIPVAPIYMLTALKGTDMYERLKAENRLLEDVVTHNATTLNFEPEMPRETLIEGYKRVIATLYDPTLENYFKRCLTLFENLEPVPHLWKPMSGNEIYAGIMRVRQQLSAAQVPAFSKFIAKVSREHPRMLSYAIYLAGLGYHFEKFTRQQIALRDFEDFLAAELKLLTRAVSGDVPDAEDVRSWRRESFARARARYESIPDDFRYLGDGVDEALQSFFGAVNALTNEPARSALA